MKLTHGHSAIARASRSITTSPSKLSATLVFDEIDAEVSVRVAQALTEKLHRFSQRHQVLCVTHQPLIAAMADSHFRVDKHTIA